MTSSQPQFGQSIFLSTISHYLSEVSMDRIKTQAAKLWQLIFAAETASTYQKAITLTGQILKESGLLLWLTLCLVLVFFEWFYKNATRAGQNARAWISHQQSEETSPDQIASGFGKALLEAGQNSLSYTLTQAKEQLGLPIPPTSSLEPAASVAKPTAPVTPATPVTPVAAQGE
jgi:hypothetical protein